MVKYLELGQIVNTFGIKGQVKVKPFTEDIKTFEKYKNVFIDKKGKLETVEIEEVKYSKNMVILKIKGVDTIEEAEKYRNFYIKIDRESAGELPEDTYYIADLIGLEVYSDEGELLGRIDDIYNAGSSDIYVVKNELGKQLLLPAISEVLKDINLDEEKIIVHIIEGLLD